MVIIDIDGLRVVFPYATLYPEQRAYMHKLKQALDCRGKAVLEMPSGTGKTITLLALITAHISNRPDSHARKFVYCTRTVEEMQKVMAEVRLLVASRTQELGTTNTLLAVGLASRRHLCIHGRVSRLDGDAVDSGCRALTASWVRDRSVAVENSHDVELCDYYERFNEQGNDAILQPGVYDLDDLREYGRQRSWCPYFLARHMINLANIVVYSYHCMCLTLGCNSCSTSEMIVFYVQLLTSNRLNGINCFFFDQHRPP
jgi:DNA excision repair protein ERCC-2